MFFSVIVVLAKGKISQFNKIGLRIFRRTFCKLFSGQARIVGGSEAPPEFGRFHASLQNVNGLHVCGGAVVSKWHIVTAAHCVHG